MFNIFFVTGAASDPAAQVSAPTLSDVPGPHPQQSSGAILNRSVFLSSFIVKSPFFILICHPSIGSKRIRFKILTAIHETFFGTAGLKGISYVSQGCDQVTRIDGIENFLPSLASDEDAGLAESGQMSRNNRNINRKSLRDLSNRHRDAAFGHMAQNGDPVRVAQGPEELRGKNITQALFSENDGIRHSALSHDICIYMQM
jgi:hypothetical protein